jgi:oxygen-independent coproporphyrinogen-3 oxidase
MGRNNHGIAEEALLSPVEMADEKLVMGLRLAEGVDAATLDVDWNLVERLEGSGHLTRDRTRIALTAKGRLLLDHILGQIALAAEPRASAVG